MAGSKICVFGAGAIGGFLAGYLARGGADVSVIARGPHLHAIQAQGLRIEAPDETFTTALPASADPADFGIQDAVLVTAKAPSLPSIAPQLAPLMGPYTAIVFLTNGVPWWYFHGHGGPLDGHRLPLLDPGDILWRTVGTRTVGGIAWPASAVPEPGLIRIRAPKTRPTILGTPDGSTSPNLEALAGAFRDAGLPVSIDPALRDRVWEKLAFNLSAGPLCVLTETPVDATQRDPALVAASRQLLTEAKALIAALGRKAVVDIDQILTLNHTLPHRPSILQDLLARRPMETDALYTTTLALAPAHRYPHADPRPPRRADPHQARWPGLDQPQGPSTPMAQSAAGCYGCGPPSHSGSAHGPS